MYTELLEAFLHKQYRCRYLEARRLSIFGHTTSPGQPSLLARATDNRPPYVVRNMAADGNATNCTDYLTKDQITQLALVQIVSGSVSAFACCLAIVLMVICQAFRSTLQRLYLYITAALTANQMVITFGVNDRSGSYYSLNERSCAIIGFLRQYTTHVWFCFSAGAVLYVYHHIRQSGSHYHRSMHATRFKARLEVFFVLFSVLFPLTYSWIPFIHNAYGASHRQPFCLIRIMKSDCSRIDAGVWYVLALAFIPTLVVGICGTILMFIITATCCRWVRRYRDIRGTFTHEPYTALLLIVYPIFYFLYFAVSIIVPFVTHTIHYWMDLWYTISNPTIKLVLPVLFIVQLYWYQKRSKRSWKNCCREPMEEEREIIQGQSEQQETFPISVNRYVPSHTCTYFPSTSTDTTQNVEAAKDNIMKVYESFN